MRDTIGELLRRKNLNTGMKLSSHIKNLGEMMKISGNVLLEKFFGVPQNYDQVAE